MTASSIDWTPLIKALNEPGRTITFSEGEVAAIYKVGKAKVRELMGTEVRASQKVEGGRWALNAFDVLKPIIEQCVRLSVAEPQET